MNPTKHALILSLVGLITLASRAGVLSVGDANYLGSINDGIPSNSSDEASYINNLITLTPGAGIVLIGGEMYNRINSTLAGPFPNAAVAGSRNDGSGFTTINATGFKYVLAKYDALNEGSYVWHFPTGAVGSVTLPSAINGRGLSHISAFNPAPASPPPPPTLTNPQILANGSLKFTFTNNPGTSFRAISSTNAALPVIDWTILGNVTEISPGQFQFIDSTASTNFCRYYRVRSP